MHTVLRVAHEEARRQQAAVHGLGDIGMTYPGESTRNLPDLTSLGAASDKSRKFKSGWGSELPVPFKEASSCALLGMFDVLVACRLNLSARSPFRSVGNG